MNTGFIWGIRSRNGRESYNNLNTANARRSRKTKGFTLVELIVVLVILAILAAIAVPTMIGFIDRAKEKNVKMAGQKALAATQTALSDIYADAGNRYSPDKRANTRTLAAVDTTENKSDTEFTVWNEKRLWDGHTVAIADNVGSYTVSKALYREGNIYAAFNGKEWETFDKKSDAMTWLKVDDSSNDLTDNVIYVWPYAQDYAYLDIVTPTDDDDGPTKDSIIKEVTLKIPRDYLSHVFFSKEGRSTNSGKESVKVVFWKESETGTEIKSYWTIDGSNKNLFKVDEYNTYWINIANAQNHTYKMTGWKEEKGGWSTTDIGKGTIQSYIFSQTDQDKFTFVAMIEDDEFIPKIATLSKPKFRDVIGSNAITSVVQTQGGAAGAYTEEMMAGFGAVRVDEARTGEGGKIYAWVDDGVLHWWTDATTAYLPENCDHFLEDKNVTSFDFSGFDAARVESMYYFFFHNTAITSVTFGSNFHADNLTSTMSMFDGCENLTSVDLANFNAENGTLKNVSYMFKLCRKLPTIEFGDGFNTENATAWDCMFLDCNAATSINVSSLKTFSATSMIQIFQRCNSVRELDLSAWDMNKVTNLTYAFEHNTSLTKIKFGDGWRLDECTNMKGTFEYCGAITNDFSEIKTSSKLKNMEFLFNGCSSVTAFNTKEWDVSGVESMNSVFANCTNAKVIDVSNWKTPNVNTLQNTFLKCVNVEKIDMSNWNMEKVTTMEGTFKELKKLQKVEMGDAGWNLKVCTSLKTTFEDCHALNQSFDKLQTSSALTNMEYMFNRCHSLTNLDLRLVNAEGVTNLYRTFKECENLQTLDVSTWNTVNLESMYETFYGDKQLTYIDMSNWKMNKVKTMEKTFNQLENLQTIVTGSGWQFDECTTFLATFEKCSALHNFDSSKIKTSSNLKNIEHVFSGCSSLNKLELAGWDVSGVTSMYRSFNNCTSLATLDVSTWNTASVTNLTDTFNNCSSLQTIDMRTWDMSKVTKANNLFQKNHALTKIRMGSGWHFDSCTEMYNAFCECRSLNQDFHEISTTNKLTNIANIFDGMTSETRIDLRNWNLTGVSSNCVNAFRNCSALRRVYANPDTCFVATSEQTKNMFNGCGKLEGGNGTTLAKNGNKTIAEFAWVDGALKDGEPQVGYFTDKPTAAKLKALGQNWVHDNVKINGNTQVNNDKINSISRNETLTEEEVLAIAGVKELSDPDFTEGYPVYFWIDSNKDVHWWSEADNVFAHENATKMFYSWKVAQISLEDLDLSLVENLSEFFRYDGNLTSVDMSAYTLENATDMTAMFRECANLQTVKMSVDTTNLPSDCSLSNLFKSDISLVNADITVTGGKVSSLESMFNGCTSLTNVDNVSLDTSNSSGVTVKNMFTGCTGFTNLSLDHLKLENVTSFDNMFSRCTNLTDLSFYACTKAGSTNVSFTNMFAESTKLANLTMKGSGEGITSTAYMFRGRTALRTVNMGEFKLSSITNLQEMFKDCTGLTSASLNIDTSASASDVSMKMMFYNDKLLTGASVVGDFSKVSSLESMFESCFKLRSINFGDDPDMSNLQTVYKIIGSINNQTDSDGIFDAFAATFKKWNLGDNQIFETRVGTNTRIKLTEATGGSYGYFDNKPVAKDGKIYMVQDKKYFYRYQ